jgi:surface antigen
MRAKTLVGIATRTVLAIATAATVSAFGYQNTASAAPATTPHTTATGTTQPAAATPQATARDLPDAPIRNDYPWKAYATRYLGGDTITARQCSAFALWRIDYRLHQPVNTTLARLAAAYRMTGAKDIDNAAARAGYRVDKTPAVGALAQYEAGTYGAGKYGHIAFVARVYTNGTILLEEYNGVHALAYSTRRINAHAVSHYIHLTHR